MLIDGAGNVSVYNTPSSNNHVANKAYVDNSIPIGGIIMWSGTIVTIPVNWRLCNGANGTPDLTNKFVICANADASTTGVGGSSGITRAHTNIESTNYVTGGTKDAVVVSHNHSGSTNKGTGEGAHTHSVSGDTPIGVYGSEMLVYGREKINLYVPGYPTQNISLTSGSAASAGSAHTHTISTDGESGTNKNLPPYYALAFIMRVF